MQYFKNLRMPALLIGSLMFAAVATAGNTVKSAPNGIQLPDNYKDWRVISVSHRTDNKSLRVIIGNDIAIKAARDGNINPWPKGTILGKLAWKEIKDENWEPAIVPDKFLHAEFMIKDPEKYQATGGWGYARWLGKEQKPYGESADFAQECMGCHTPVQGQDWVFTRPVTLP